MVDYGMFWLRLTRIIKESLHMYDEVILKDCLNLYQLLKKGKFDSDNHLIFNDLDNEAWYIKHDELMTICLSDQNCYFIIFIKKEKETMIGTGCGTTAVLAAYLYYDDFNKDTFEEYDSDYKVMPFSDKVSVETYLSGQSPSYSDCYEGNKYVHLPNLDYILKHNIFIGKRIGHYPLIRLGHGSLYHLSARDESESFWSHFKELNSLLLDIEFSIEAVERGEHEG